MNQFLLGVECYSGNQPVLLKHLSRKLSEFVEILAISSVYQINPEIAATGTELSLSRDPGEQRPLCLAIKGECAMPALELVEQLSQAEKNFCDELEQRQIGLDLLTFNHNLSMIPGLTLPHPELYLRPQALVPAAEIWPDYEHPVLNRTLSDLTRSLPHTLWGEFYGQGRRLLGV